MYAFNSYKAIQDAR